MRIFEQEIAGFRITLENMGPDNYRVKYGAHERALLGYDAASKELGRCIFHALACEGKLDPR